MYWLWYLCQGAVQAVYNVSTTSAMAGCLHSAQLSLLPSVIQKCPFDAIMIINLPKNLEKETTHRYSANSFKLHRLPVPRPGQVALSRHMLSHWSMPDTSCYLCAALKSSLAIYLLLLPRCVSITIPSSHWQVLMSAGACAVGH